MTAATPPPESDSDRKPAEPSTPKGIPDVAWVVSTYAAQGFPYSIVVNLANLYFIAMGASLQAVGLTSLFHVPWNLKAFTGPFFDQYGTKRRWLLGIEALLVTALIVFAVTVSFGKVLLAASIMFLIVAVLSANHDIAIDGLYLEALDKKRQETFVGARAMVYRLAMFVVTGPIAFLCDRASWTVGFIAMAAFMGLLLAVHIVILPRTETEKRPFRELFIQALSLRFFAIGAMIAIVIAAGRAALSSEWLAGVKTAASAAAPKLAEKVGKLDTEKWIGLFILATLLVVLALLPIIRSRIERSKSNYARSFVSFLAQPFAGRILLYIILFRLGESFLQAMRAPFLRNEVHLSQAEYAFVYGTVGMVLNFVAPFVGGLLIGKYGFKRCLIPFLLAQNGLHLVFAVAAVFSTEIANATTPLYAIAAAGAVIPVVDARLLIATLVTVVEICGAGLGTAAFMVYLIRACSPEHKAAHMALLTSLMSVAFTLSGVFSGFIAEWIGFPLYFAMTFVVTVPGMLLTFWVPHVIEKGSPPQLGRTT